MNTIKLRVGSPKIDETLEGGLYEGELTLIYGEPGAGKTSLALQIALRACFQGFKVLYLYSDGLFPHPKLEALMNKMGLYLEDSTPLHILQINYFDELERAIREIELGFYKEYDALVFDTFTGPYRSIQVEKRQEVIKHNKKLNQLTAILKSYATSYGKHIILTSRLKSPTISGEGLLDEPIASNVLTYWSDNIISIMKLDLPFQRKIVVLKIHGSEVNIEIQAHVIDGYLEEVD